MACEVLSEAGGGEGPGGLAVQWPTSTSAAAPKGHASRGVVRDIRTAPAAYRCCPAAARGGEHRVRGSYAVYAYGNLVTHVYAYGKIGTHRRLFTHGCAVVY